MPDENQNTSPSTISRALTDAKLGSMQHPGEFSDEDRSRKKREMIEKLQLAITNSLFLDDKRKTMWINALYILELEEAEALLGAILRENLRYKKNIRKLKFKEIPERVSEETPTI